MMDEELQFLFIGFEMKLLSLLYRGYKQLNVENFSY